MSFFPTLETLVGILSIYFGVVAFFKITGNMFYATYLAHYLKRLKTQILYIGSTKQLSLIDCQLSMSSFLTHSVLLLEYGYKNLTLFHKLLKPDLIDF